MYDVIIIGSGPAGLSASVYAKRAGLKALTLEKNPVSGGQVLNTYEVDTYLGLPGINGFDMGMKFREHADGLGCEFQTAEVLSVCKEHREEKQLKAASVNETAVDAAFEPVRAQGFMIETDEGVFRAKAVVAAMGAVHAKLGIPGEEEMAGRGVSYCATCDGPLIRGQNVLVIGGGNSAVQEAFYLLKFCDKATLLVRSRLRCDDTLRERLEHEPRISVELGVVPTKIEQADQELSVISEDDRTFSAHNIFIFIGQRPATTFLPAEVLAEDNSVVTDKNYMTKIPGLFAAGDCRYESVHQVVAATGEGAAAAVAIRNYLK